MLHVCLKEEKTGQEETTFQFHWTCYIASHLTSLNSITGFSVLTSMGFSFLVPKDEVVRSYGEACHFLFTRKSSIYMCKYKNADMKIVYAM